MNKIFIVTFSLHPINYRVEKIFNKLPNNSDVTTISSSYSELPNYIYAKPLKNPFRLLKKIGFLRLFEIISRIVYFPSLRILLVKRMIKILNKEIRKNTGNNIIVITINPPHDLAIVGFKVKKKFPQIKWINDWQDLWSYDEYYFNNLSKSFQNKVLKLEKKMFDICDLNIATNYMAKDILINKYKLPAERVVDIPHPFDKEDIVGFGHHSDKVFNRNKIKIGFLGYINKPPKMPGLKVLQAINNLIILAEKKSLNIEFHLYGDDQEDTLDFIKHLDNPNIFSYPRTPRIESFANIINSDFLMICMSKESLNTRIVMNEKLPHYLMLNRPILALVPSDSFVAEVIQKTRSGFVLENENKWSDDLLDILLKFDFQNYKDSVNQEEINKYSNEAILCLWETAMDKLLN